MEVDNKSVCESVAGSTVPAGSTFVGAAEEELICDGKYVVVERGDQQRILLFKSHQTIIFGKGVTQQDILLKGALGKPFLSAFKASPAPPEVVANHKPSNNNDKGKPWKKSGKGKAGQNQNLFILEQSTEPVAKIINEFYQLPETVSSGADNRNIFDDNKSQALKKKDIASLREQGVPSKEILDTIITSSKSFGQKTEFAQEKYLKKKEKIYGDVLVFMKPSIPILSDYYFKKDPQKVLGLRPDTLSQILSYANVHANGKYLVFENCFGLIMAAVIRRLGGNGMAFHCHVGSNPQRQAMVCMNFTDEDLKPMKSLDLLFLLKPPNSTDKIAEENKNDIVESSSLEDGPQTKKLKLDSENVIIDSDMDKNGNQVSNEQTDEVEDEDTSFVASSKLRYVNNKEDNEKSLEYFNETEFDGLIISAKEHPLTLFQRLTQRLAPSSPFVIYCQYPEPLMDCYIWAKEKGVGCNVHLVDNWFRNIQVETERTHPEINMSPSGGFLLYGTYTG